MKLERALTFLENVTNKAEAVPMRRYAGSTGRTAQGEWIWFSLSILSSWETENLNIRFSPWCWSRIGVYWKRGSKEAKKTLIGVVDIGVHQKSFTE